MEIWKSIEGHPGFQISSEGQVRIADGTITYVDGTSEFIRGSLLDIKENDGMLCVNFKSKTYFIHRLMADAFLEHPAGATIVSFKDNDKLNCSLDNLQWITTAESVRNAIENGNRNSPPPYTGMPIECVTTGETFKSITQLATTLGISKNKVSKMIRANKPIFDKVYKFI